MMEMMEELLPYNQDIDHYRKSYPEVEHRMRKIPTEQKYWEVPVIVRTVKETEVIREDASKEINKLQKNINITETKIDDIKYSYRYIKYIILILILMFIYLVILLLLNLNIKQ